MDKSTKKKIRALIDYAKTELKEPFGQLWEETNLELYIRSDRATALMLAEKLNNGLEKLITYKIKNSGSFANERDVNAFFNEEKSVFGPFSSKIQCCFAFNFIGPIVENDLQLIRNIRNTFAHTPKAMSFSTPQVEDVCNDLRVIELDNLKMVPYHYLELCKGNNIENYTDRQNPKTRFIWSCYQIAYRLWVARGADGSLNVAKFDNDNPLP